MSTNIGCYTGCDRPVIGQCTGYEEACNRFYCAEHSEGTLCGECTSKQVEDRRIQEIYVDYLETAKWFEKSFGGEWLEEVKRNVRSEKAQRYTKEDYLAIISFILLIIFGYIALTTGSTIATWFCIALILYWGAGGFYDFIKLSQKREVFHAKKLEEMEKVKPGFSTFYHEWKRDKSVQSAKIAGAILLSLVGTAAVISEDVKKERLRRDTHDIAKSLEEIKRKID